MIEYLIDTIDELNHLIEELKISGLQVQIDYLKDLRRELVIGSDLTTRQKLMIYNKLFPPRGGLSDMNYWTDNFKLRKRMNERLNSLKIVISDYLLEV